MQTAIIAILVLGFLVFVHEFGHFAAAKLSGMRVEEFSIGMGPTIYSVQKKETKYNLGALPIGGYVRVTGEYAQEFDDGVLDVDDERRYQNRPIWQRFIFVSAGSLMNFLTAIVLFSAIFWYIGIPTPLGDNTVSAVVEGGAAQQAGIIAGDKIIAINGETTSTWEDITHRIEESQGQTLYAMIERNGEQLTFQVTPVYNETERRLLLGIQQDMVMKQGDLLQSVRYGVKETYEITLLLIDAVGNLITGQVAVTDDEEGLMGPVGIFQTIDTTAKAGAIYVVNLMALLSVNLGLLNILPIPALDGSKLVFLAIEGLRGKPVDPSKENFVHFIGFALLMLLMIVVTYKDILRLFS